MSEKVKIIDINDVDKLKIEALKGNTLAANKESQMLINFEISGVSINQTPRKDGRYQGYAKIGNNKKYFYGKNLTEVVDKIQLYVINNYTKPQPVITKTEEKTKKLTFGEWCNTYIKLYKENTLKPKSLESLKLTLKRPIATFGNIPLKDIKTDDIQEFLLSIEGGRTKDLTKTILNGIFKKAYITKKINSNPMLGIELKKHKPKKILALSIEEQNIFLEKIKGSKYNLLFNVLLKTGIRIGEALALTGQDIDINQKTITINKNIVTVKGKEIIQNTPKSEAGNRTIPLPLNLFEELKTKTELNRLFPFSYNACKLFLSKLDLPFKITLHQLRHTYATRLDEAGVPPKVKQYLLGHATLEMTEQVYTDVKKEFIYEQFNKINGIFS